MLYQPSRHEPLINTNWSTNAANDAISHISNSVLEEFQGKKLWPVHPDLKDFLGFTSPITNLWNGAAGTIWALDELAKAKLINLEIDLVPYLDDLMALHPLSLQELPKSFEVDINTPGYLLGYSSLLLLKWKLTHKVETLDQLAQLIADNANNKNWELMYASPGTMLVAWFLYQETKQDRFATLFKQSADQLFNSWEYSKTDDCYNWTQDMYGTSYKFLGVVHGFAGNVFPLFKGFNLLDSSQQQKLIKQTLYTYTKTAKVNEKHANWPMFSNKQPKEEMLLQLCHGVPGIVIGLADCYPHMNKAEQDIFAKAISLVWDAGPLVKPWGLCHGTAGNGYTFLKYYSITKDEIWLTRARKFAMHAIMQSKKMQEQYKCIRSDNWCGDMGLAIYLKDCINPNSNFPLLDYF